MDVILKPDEFLEAFLGASKEMPRKIGVITRVFRDGSVLHESFPLWYAEIVMEMIPLLEPDVARARLVTFS